MKFTIAMFIYAAFTSSMASGINPNLTAEYISRNKSIELRWQNPDEKVTAYLLQRSDDNHSWKDIYTLEAGNFQKKNLEKFYDISAGAAKNYYRLKICWGNEFEYSASIMVIIGSPVGSWVIYPVPVKNILNIQYNGSDPIRGVVSIFIQNINGYVLLRKRYSSLTRTIQVPVDNLGKGVYDIRIVINNETVWNQRFLK